MTPTQRTLAALRKAGWTCAVVERWNQYARVRHDLFGFADVLAIGADGILAVQATTGANHAARREKILSEPRAAIWLAAGGLVEIWSWRVAGKRGTRKLWTPRVERISQGKEDRL